MPQIKYNEIIYPDREDTYTPKLCQYLVDRFFADGILIDLGCGTGIHIKQFKKMGLQCKGIDKNLCDLESEELPLDNDYIENAFCKSVIEHLNNPDNLMNETYRVLKQEGIFVIMTPDWKSQMRHFWDDHTHKQPYTQKSLMNLLKIYGFRNVGCELFYQIPFIWEYPFLTFIPKIISLLPAAWKWKNKDMANGSDRKLIRFSKEKMLLAWGVK